MHKVLDCSNFIRAPGSWSPRDEPKSFPASSLILLNSLEQQGSVTRTESSWTKRTQRRFPSREEGERARRGWVTWRWASLHESQVDSNYSHEWSECCRVNKFLWLEIKNRWKHTHTEEDMTSERKQRTVAVITFGLPLQKNIYIYITTAAGEKGLFLLKLNCCVWSQSKERAQYLHECVESLCCHV